MNLFRIKQYAPGNGQKVYSLIKAVYDEFVAPENSEGGNNLFYQWIAPNKIANRQKQQNNMWLAWDEEKIVGVIEMRDRNNITLFFVDKHYQNRGIARLLFQTAIAACTKRTPTIEKFHVHASICSVPVYKCFGFYETGKAHKRNGIHYVPMEMDINGQL